ncbi:uncharacterized protein TNCV_1001731 [Trichonephila clavipes]|nr:uncharacterized protein TNCV_1001731 [Trichonephila clavipes]
MSFGSRRPTKVPLLNVCHRTARLAWAREHRDWIVEDWKRVAWSDESRFQLLNADGRLRIWHQAHEAMDPACQNNVSQNFEHQYVLSAPSCGPGGLVVKVTNLWLAYQGFETSTAEDPPCRRRARENLSMLKRSPVVVVGKLEQWVLAQVSSSSLDQGSKLRGPSQKLSSI